MLEEENMHIESCVPFRNNEKNKEKKKRISDVSSSPSPGL